MTRTGKGGFKPKRQRPTPVARFKLWVKGGGQIKANAQAVKPVETEEHPQAGLFRYLNPGRAK